MWHQCFYKTLDLAPTATDHEIRSAYRRCALSTHPDKGGSAEAFRSVVHAFETLIDVSRRAAYDQLRRCPNKSSFAAGSEKKEVRPSQKRHGESNTEPANLAKSAKDKPKPAPAAPEGQRKKAKPQPPPATEPNSTMDCDTEDHPEFFRRLLRMPKKQVLLELQKLSEEALNAFAEFLESQQAEEILSKLCESRPRKLRMLALKGCPKTRKREAVQVVPNRGDSRKNKEMPKATKPTGRMNSDTPTAPTAPTAPTPRLAKPRLKGISCNNRYGGYHTYIVLFTSFMTNVQCVKNLDTAIDMHISLVQMRQYVDAGLVEGKDFRQVLRDAIDTIQKERTTAGAEELRLRFRSYVRSGPRTQRYTATSHDLDKAIQDWMEVTGLTEPSREVGSASAKALREEEKARMLASREEARAARLELARQKAEQREANLIARQRRQEQREARLLSRQKRQEQRQARLLSRQKQHEVLQNKRLALARVKHGRLRAMVLALQARFQKVWRQKLLKAWGVPELPEGLQLSSFQSADDSLCATLRLSDGTEVVGPYRKNFQQALQELQELRALQQRRGDQALQKEMQRRDVEAMTAFFVESIS
eukprot:s1602_g6.t1